MRLNDFEKKVRGTRTRYVARVANVAGTGKYELVLAGAEKSLSRVFADSDFQLTIDPGRRFEAAEREFLEAGKEQTRSFEELARLENSDQLPLFKKLPPNPSPNTCVHVSLRRVTGEGTFWGPISWRYFLPTNWSIFFWLPPLQVLSACVAPVSGDQDLFLLRDWFFPSPLSSSRRGGTATDCVFFSDPPLTPARLTFLSLRIFGFTSGSGNFSMKGFS